MNHTTIYTGAILSFEAGEEVGIVRKRMIGIIGSFLLILSPLAVGVAAPASAVGNRTITLSVDCTPGPVAGVWVVDSTNGSRSGWATTITRSGSNAATITYNGTNAGDSWGANVGCGINNGDYAQWKYSTSTFNSPGAHTTTANSAYVICLAGYSSQTGTNGCIFN